MDNEQSKDNEQSMPSRHQTIGVRSTNMTNHLFGGLLMVSLPCVFWWKDWVRSFAKARGEPDPLRNKRAEVVSKDFSHHKKTIVALFKAHDWDAFAIGDPGDMIVIVVDEKKGKMRHVPRIKHGQLPILDAEHDEDYYKAYIPGANNPMMGLAVFPPNSSPHPIAWLSNKRRVDSSATGIKISVENLDYSRTIGTVSPVQARKIKVPAEHKCLEAFHPYHLLEFELDKMKSPEPETSS